MRGYERIDRRSLALHAAMASKLETDSAVRGLAGRNVDRWLSSHPNPAIAEWKRILEETSVDDSVRLLRATDENAARLRQPGPFAGVLSAEERPRILKAHDPSRS